ncbi:unnamed protein product [Heligmosomoides polygyrus]|uniref:Phlebovirus glycoprotein G2 fusion domain-containing protein n=1 Tax=Heligmosomoides polygyrus TaxID=6339 RepID=A0A183GA72_HELPZ|nr:unnamed protein product [Heligmosomoides polygyrus]
MCTWARARWFVVERTLTLIALDGSSITLLPLHHPPLQKKRCRRIATEEQRDGDAHCFPSHPEQLSKIRITETVDLAEILLAASGSLSNFFTTSWCHCDSRSAAPRCRVSMHMTTTKLVFATDHRLCPSSHEERVVVVFCADDAGVGRPHMEMFDVRTKSTKCACKQLLMAENNSKTVRCPGV